MNSLATHPAAAHLQRVANYLTHNVPVVAASGAQGVLCGLPYCEPWERPAAVIRCPDTDYPSGMDLVDVNADTLKLVLWAPEDLPTILHLLPLDVQQQIGDLTSPFKREDEIARVLQWIQNWAARIDLLRQHGIALNMAPGSYVRREVAPTPSPSTATTPC